MSMVSIPAPGTTENDPEPAIQRKSSQFICIAYNSILIYMLRTYPETGPTTTCSGCSRHDQSSIINGLIAIFPVISGLAQVRRSNIIVKICTFTSKIATIYIPSFVTATALRHNTGNGPEHAGDILKLVGYLPQQFT
jgi:hypothetical protein